jgi:hypothetical protein
MKTDERGFAVIFVMLLAAALLVLIAAASGVVSSIHDSNKKEMKELRLRAETLKCRGPAESPPPEK